MYIYIYIYIYIFVLSILVVILEESFDLGEGGGSLGSFRILHGLCEILIRQAYQPRLLALVVRARGATFHLGLDVDNFGGLAVFVMLVDLWVTGLPQILFYIQIRNQNKNS